MTTSVTVSAHCDDKTEVSVIVGGNEDEDTTLQNGQEQTFYVYDDRVVVVLEVPKED